MVNWDTRFAEAHLLVFREGKKIGLLIDIQNIVFYSSSGGKEILNHF